MLLSSSTAFAIAMADYSKCSSSDRNCFDSIAESAIEKVTLDEGMMEQMAPIMSIALLVINLAATKNPKSTCKSSMILFVVALAALATELYLYRFAEINLDKIESTYSLTQDNYENQIKALNYLKKQQEIIVTITEKKANFYTFLSIGYGAALAMAVFDMKSKPPCYVKPEKLKKKKKKVKKKTNSIFFHSPTGLFTSAHAFQMPADLSIESLIPVLLGGGVAFIAFKSTDKGKEILSKIEEWTKWAKKPDGVAIMTGIGTYISWNLSAHNRNLQEKAEQNVKELKELINNLRKKSPKVEGNVENESTSSSTIATSDYSDGDETQVEQCINSAGNIETNCDCRTTLDKVTLEKVNNCYKVQMPQKFSMGLSKAANTAFENNLKKVEEGTNKMLAGDYSVSNLGLNGEANKMAKNNAIISGAAVTDLNDDLKRKGKETLSFNKDFANKTIKGIATPKIMTVFKDSPMAKNASLYKPLDFSKSSGGDKSIAINSSPDSLSQTKSAIAPSNGNGKNTIAKKDDGDFGWDKKFTSGNKKKNKSLFFKFNKKKKEKQKKEKREIPLNVLNAKDIIKNKALSIFDIISYGYAKHGLKRIFQE